MRSRSSCSNFSDSMGQCGLTRCRVCSCDRGRDMSGVSLDQRPTVETSLKATEWEGDRRGSIPGGQSLRFMPCLRKKVSQRSWSSGKVGHRLEPSGKVGQSMEPSGKMSKCRAQTRRTASCQRMDRKTTMESGMKQTRSRSIGQAQNLLFMPSLREKVRQRSKSAGRDMSHCRAHATNRRGRNDMECGSDPYW